MEGLNTILSHDESVVMRAVWETPGWGTVDDICALIWQSGFSRNKTYKILRRLEEIKFISVKKRSGRNYYAQRVGAAQYYPDLHENPKEFIKTETIKVKGSDCIEKLKRLNGRALEEK